MRVAVRLFAIALACSSAALLRCKTSDCNDSGHIVYECDPQPASVPGCTGDVPDATFPEGCAEALPCTSGNQTQQICNCQRQHFADGGTTPFAWTCGA